MNTKFYKIFKELPLGYPAQLHEWLKVTKNANDYFQNAGNKATDMRDFEAWPDNPVDRNHLVMYGEIMLVDLEMPECNHAYVICEVTRGRHKLSSGRVIHLKPLVSIMPIKNLPADVNWKNGYFLLPKLESL